jgi:NADH-quinone oxidoreductase subunit I
MYGEGIVKGMAETAKNFVKSYVDENRLTTVQYPEERLPMTPATRNFPFLVFDSDPEKGLRCVACKICEKECPPQCIYIILERDEKGKPKKHPKIFDIDISVCMSCQICVEVCPFDAIKMDQVYELSRTDRFEGLLLHKTDLRKSNEYFHQIHPDEAAEVDARLNEEKAKAAAKAVAAAAPKAPTASPATAGPAAGGATSPAAVKTAPVQSVAATKPTSFESSANASAMASPAQSPVAEAPTPTTSTSETKAV